ncbi:hypothetical protein [Bradyrhizobium elkanii]|uniref:hypothetical protein n=1 Tax=Bradyrhizobium elkanii TaxID=29448 RepID=UPI001449A553|nr:hypothetical protein [Bradyrhizobium elkanii]MCP1932557.1 hypothetical protein [Bradyrhizobium elkanii]MCS3479516.1 hypothetical protein [Bradyrhizobium elkanii]MCS3576901.1 hypothetical protein [Bradyrhizobium elkanii]MCS3719778.1 hypothetical protein [Bradyrhizobium elkanii]MCS4004195.1 hypothetical protein [Bradyrhizobium elkanii USDA 61]
MSRDYMGKSEIDSERRDALADASLDDEGIDFALVQLCKYLGVDPDDVTWDAATETVDGDVQAVIGNIFCTKFGEDWSPSDPHSSERIAVVQGDLDRESNAAESYHAFWIEERGKRIATEARLAEALEALKPFASLADATSEQHRNDRPIVYGLDPGIVKRLLVGDLRGARAVVSGSTEAANG